ncbi:MAG: FecR domain-containing protein [Clostridia bacterium]|nr:FecR domain-containing protein [Deltaproteobacteria bacterium]
MTGKGSVTRRMRAKRNGHPVLVALVALGAAALVGFFVTLAVFSAHAADNKAGSVTFVEGEASIVRGDIARGESLSVIAVGAALYAGDRLKTSASAKLEAKLSDGSLLRLAPGSDLRLDAAMFRKSGEKKVRVSLSLGRVWASVTKLFGSGSEFEVQTNSAVAGVRGTRFTAEKSTGGDTVVKVYGGAVLVANTPIYAKPGHTKGKRFEVPGPSEVTQGQWTELVAGAMQEVRVSASGQVGPAESFVKGAPDDGWEAWNTERDKLAGVKE